MGEREVTGEKEEGMRERERFSLLSSFFLNFPFFIYFIFFKKNPFLRILISKNFQKDSKKSKKNVNQIYILDKSTSLKYP